MRKIIFRGKRTDNGEWVEGFYTLYANNRGLHPCILTGTEQGCVIPAFVIPETVGQFTGYIQEDGTRIFEGDILEQYSSRAVVVAEISSCGCCHDVFGFSFRDKDGDITDAVSFWIGEVIGNIYDNPELLEDCK